mgnify:CR=1 FL=1
MAVPFAAVVTPDSIVFTSPDGKTHTISSQHENFQSARDTIKAVQAARNAGDDAGATAQIERLVALVNPAQVIVEKGEGKVEVRDGVVYYEGEPVYSALTERILWGLSEGYDMKPYINFLANVQQNPSKRAVDELFTFVERNKMGITEDGYILGYKRVRGDFKDIYTGTIDNSPGQIVTMPRNKVNDNPNATCSHGLHFCSQSYLPHYGAGEGNRIVIVKVNPADVVSVPVDYNAAKVRCCRYEVLSEYTGTDKDDLLGTKAVFQTAEFTGHYGSGTEVCKGEMVEFIGDEGSYDHLGADQDLIYGNLYEVEDVHAGEVKIAGVWVSMDDVAPAAASEDLDSDGFFDDYSDEYSEDYSEDYSEEVYSEDYSEEGTADGPSAPAGDMTEAGDDVAAQTAPQAPVAEPEPQSTPEALRAPEVAPAAQQQATPAAPVTFRVDPRTGTIFPVR